MTNQAEILRTIFHSVNANGEISGPTYGVCIYDNHGNGYCDSIEDLETLTEMSPSDIVELAFGIEPQGAEIIDDILDFQSPIFIDNVPYRVTRSEEGFEASLLSESKAG